MAEKRKISQKALNERFSQRITLARQGNMAAKEGDLKNTIKFYNMYLKILADYKGVEEIYQLNPQHFNVEKELSEILLISHIYWDLCKMYDATPKLEVEFRKSLGKFVEFTQGFKYQVVNAEMLRKFIKRDRQTHKKEFREAYKRIYISSKKCYVATHCFGEDHIITNDLRVLKAWLTQFYGGQLFIDHYYAHSPSLIRLCKKSKSVDFIVTRLLGRPLLRFFWKLYWKIKKSSRINQAL